MREIKADLLRQTVKNLFLEASYVIGQDIYDEITRYCEKEESEVGKATLKQLLQNYDISRNERIAICQDTGLAILFIELGQDARIVGGDFNEAINQGVRETYSEGYLRKSAVTDPLYDRKNTHDNTPAIVHLSIVPGDKIKILVTPKGFGSENMSAIKMMKPADGEKGVRDFVVETAVKAGPNPCPPIVLGVGIGGTMEKAAMIAKKATLRPIGQHNPDERFAKLEKDILTEINKSGVGPAGLGGRTTVLAVNIDHFPTHIAGMPVAVNICCHAARHAELTI